METHRPERFRGFIRRPTLGYVLAVVGPALMLLLRLRIGVFFEHRPLLILFVFPILIAAYIGGLGPGLLATAVTAAVTAFWLIPPIHSLAFGMPHDTWQWLFLCANGVAISVMSGWLHRAMQRAEKLSALEAQLADVAATVPGILYSFQLFPDGRTAFIYASPGFHDLLGDETEKAGRNAGFTFDRMAPEDAERVRAGMLASAESLAPWHDEFRMRHASRGWIWIEGRSRPRRLPDGSTLWHGFAADITERKRIDEQLQDARAFTQATMDALTAHICVVDAQGTILAVNRAWRAFGTANGLAGTRASCGANYLQVCDAVQGGDAPLARAFAQGIRDVLAGHRDTFEAEYPCHSPDAQRWFIGRVTHFPAAAGRRAVVAHQEITRQKVAELAVMRSEYLHHALIETIPDLVWLKDPDGVFLSCNPAFGRLYGAAEADIIGKKDVDFVGPELAAFFRENDLAAIATGKPQMNEEWLTFASDGYRGYFETIKAPVRDPAGRLIGVLGIARDITARQRAETERNEQLDELRRWHAVTLNREARVAELKREVNDHAARLGLQRPYSDPESASP